MTWRVLDLFCGAGGAAMGLHRAWPDAEIIGVDIKPQKHYPFTFVQGDALKPPLDLNEFDFIWASPPCQAYSVMRHLSLARNGKYPDHPKLIEPTRALLEKSKSIYVIENVGGARRALKSSIFLCGTYFDLKVYRHRWFESNRMLLQPPHIEHRDNMPSPGSRQPISRNGYLSVTSGIRPFKEAQSAMDIYWMDAHEIGEAIPPAYSEYIARQIRQP